MKKTLGICIAMVCGSVIGAVVTWYYAKKKYEEIAQEEVDSVKEEFSKRDKQQNTAITVNLKALNDPDIQKTLKELNAIAAEIFHEQGYLNDEDDGLFVDYQRPYVIPPEEFMNQEDYDHISLTYYADGVLTDDNDERIEDVDRVVGIESLNHFGEFEDDSVFVRNDKLKAEYEILRDERSYAEVIRSMPRPMRME